MKIVALIKAGEKKRLRLAAEIAEMRDRFQARIQQKEDDLRRATQELQELHRRLDAEAAAKGSWSRTPFADAVARAAMLRIGPFSPKNIAEDLGRKDSNNIPTHLSALVKFGSLRRLRVGLYEVVRRPA